MDKNTLSQYGWVTIVIIIIVILLGFASPFGMFMKNVAWETIESFKGEMDKQLDIFSDEQFIIRNGTEIINTTDEISPGGEGYIKYEILTKIVLKENKNYSKFRFWDKTLLENYVNLHQANLKNDTRIYLIYTEKYKNFTINIYPLDIEGFIYDNILNPKILGFINFTDGFSFLNEYKDTNDTYILVILLESNNTNSSINELSYYFYKYNEA